MNKSWFTINVLEYVPEIFAGANLLLRRVAIRAIAVLSCIHQITAQCILTLLDMYRDYFVLLCESLN